MPGNAAPDSAATAAVVARRSAVRFGARTVLIAVAMALLSVPFALLLVLVEDKWPPLARVDAGARDGLYRYAVDHPLFVSVMKTLSAIGSTIVYVVALAATAVWLLWRRLPRLAVFAVVTVWGGVLLNNLVKIAVHRARPVLLNPVAHAAGQSFPSGHAQSAVVAYGVLLVVFLSVRYGPWRRLAMAAAALMVLAIGFSRIALGVHYASDVLAGYLLGAAWVAAMTAAFNAWRVERGDSEQQAPDGHAPRLQ